MEPSHVRKHECMTQQRGKKADLAPSSLDHELSGQVGGRLRLQRSDHDAFIQRVTGNDLKEDTQSSTMQETGEKKRNGKSLKTHSKHH